MYTQQAQTSQCCPKFDPAPWDGKVFEWDKKKFIKAHLFTFFYIPVNFGGLMKRSLEKISGAGAVFADALCLSDHTSKWNMDVYLAVDRDIPGAENTAISGKFLGKVYEGPFKDTGKWCQDFEGYAKGRGLDIKKTYMWYTTCPKCAKVYGKNYVVLIGQLE